jgi:hypothetical protein
VVPTASAGPPASEHQAGSVRVVLDPAAVAHTAIRAEGDDRAPDEVEQFRRFLDTATPADFDPD